MNSFDELATVISDTSNRLQESTLDHMTTVLLHELQFKRAQSDEAKMTLNLALAQLGALRGEYESVVAQRDRLLVEMAGPASDISTMPPFVPPVNDPGAPERVEQRVEAVAGEIVSKAATRRSPTPMRPADSQAS